jgi:peptidoglycan-associated lipoprotein
MSSIRVILLALAALSLAACAPKGAVKPEAEAAEVAVPSPSAEAAAASAQASALPGVPAPLADPMAALDAPGSLLAQRIVYFDFDRSEIRSDMLEMLKAHAAFLIQHPAIKVRLEGHADERGTREYNIGLGDRRAQAVRRVLLFQGVESAQLQPVSYGEERPVADGHDDAAWSKNRRVELVYK